MATGKEPPPERAETDSSLRAERQQTDDELGKSGGRAEEAADRVVERARERADATVEAASAKADDTMTRAGASEAARGDVTRAETVQRAALADERDTADRALDHEREERRRTVAALLERERGRTDDNLSLERAAADLGLAKIIAELTEALRIRDEFLSVASHELRTPLTPISLQLGSLAREAAKHPDSALAKEVVKYTAVATRQTKRLSNLVADLLDVSRLSSGKPTLELDSVDLGTLVHGVVDRHQPQAERASCTLRVDAPTVVGHWDALRLEQLVTDLLDNALKFGRGHPIHVRVEAIDSMARLTVRDEGIGIPPTDLPRIFERFERGVSQRNYGGLGLGLYVCRAIAEALGGTIAVQSEEGQGATFTVELPLEGPRTGFASTEALESLAVSRGRDREREQ